MTITIGAFTTTKLLVQPFGYDEVDTRAGLSARKVVMSGLLTPEEWSALLTEYNTWRDTRIEDEDTLSSGVVGTTVAVSASGNTISWSAVPSWFISAPSGQQAGAYIQASCELVDAEEALEVLLREAEKQKENSAAEQLDIGTVTLGDAVIKLTAPMETFQEAPQLQLTVSGSHYLTGPLTATRVRQIQGTTDSAGWTALLTWYETTVAATPAADDWFPISAPTASAEATVTDGVKSTLYTVSIAVAEVK